MKIALLRILAHELYLLRISMIFQQNIVRFFIYGCQTQVEIKAQTYWH